MSAPDDAIPVPPDLPEDIAAIAHEGTPEAAARLAAIAGTTDRKRAKAAKKALFLLRQRGVEPPAEAGDGNVRAPSAPHQKASAGHDPGQPHAYLTFPFREKDVVLILSPDGEESPCGSVLLRWNGILAQCVAWKMTVAAFRRQYAETQSEEGQRREVRLAAMDLDFGHHLLKDCAHRTRRAGALVPFGYSDILKRLPKPRRVLSKHPVYELIPEDRVRSDPMGMRAPAILLRQAILPLRWLAKDRLTNWVERAVEVRSSRIVLTDEQKRHRFAQLSAEAADDLITDERRDDLAWYLETLSLTLALEGKQQMAELTLHSAVAARSAPSSGRWPLGQQLIHMFLDMGARAILGEKPEEDKPEDEDIDRPHIIIPGR